MPIFRGTNNISKIFRGNTEIVKAFRGVDLIFQSGEPEYELIADINVTTNTTQIDFDNLNITKDDELRLVYTFTQNVSGFEVYRLFVNNNTTNTNYWNQQLEASGSLLKASRENANLLTFAETNIKTSGFADIKVSNNDRFVAQNHFTYRIGSNANTIQQRNYNLVSTFAVSSITSLSLQTTNTNGIGVGSRLQLYKVVR